MEHISTIIYENFLSPYPSAPKLCILCCQPFLVAKLQGILLFGINYSFQIKYFIKKVKQNVQFMHAVASLSTYSMKIFQRGEVPQSV